PQRTPAHRDRQDAAPGGVAGAHRSGLTTVSSRSGVQRTGALPSVPAQRCRRRCPPTIRTSEGIDMSIALKPGTRLLSAVCATEMIAVRAPGGEVDVTIGGVPPVLDAAERGDGPVAEGFGGGTAMG